MSIIATVEDLERLYGLPAAASLVKEVDRVTPHYRAFIEAAPFVALATAGPEGLDCSPRGDRRGFVRIHDERTLMMPDRRGNKQRAALVTLSIGVAQSTAEGRRFTDPREVVGVASEMKKVAKSQPGSYVAIDRRRADSDTDEGV